MSLQLKKRSPLELTLPEEGDKKPVMNGRVLRAARMGCSLASIKWDQY